MKKRDTSDVLASIAAAAADAVAVFAGGLLAVFIRFDTGIPLLLERDPNLYARYAHLCVGLVIIALLVFRYLGLYRRPQLGRYETKIPRLVRACAITTIGVLVINAVVKNVPRFSFSVVATLISFFTISLCVILERWAAFRIELHNARHAPATNRVLILGADDVAARLAAALAQEPRLRTRVAGHILIGDAPPDAQIDSDRILGGLEQFETIAEREDGALDQVILAGSSEVPHDRVVELILYCERHLIHFNMVPDVYRILTASMEVQTVGDIPLLGVSEWPLDHFWNRVLKRLEDIAGSLVGLIVSAPLMAWGAYMVRRESPGPVFYRQKRCGENGRSFTLYKLRTMRPDAESTSGPVFTQRDDPRTTRWGARLRAWNLDELPQFFNVLRGDMSMVGPRPERPFFVEQFKGEIARYMWRHVSKPGITGWAQINGLRGNTSIEERIKYDLFYLENWSLAFDFKILVRTFFARENAY